MAHPIVQLKLEYANEISYKKTGQFSIQWITILYVEFHLTFTSNGGVTIPNAFSSIKFL